jgi:hypothetical protein
MLASSGGKRAMGIGDMTVSQVTTLLRTGHVAGI